MSNVYERLKDKIDHLGFGYDSDNGGDIQFLKALFSEEDAEYAIELSGDRFETPAELAARLNKDESEVAEKLDDMGYRGLIFYKREDGVKKYRVMPFAVGFLEFTFNRPSEAKNMAVPMLLGSSFQKMMWATKTPEFYYVPVNAELITGSQVIPRDDAMQIIDGKDPNRIALAMCACRAATKAAGTPCKHIGFDETCLWFDDYADYFVERGDARYITGEYAKNMLMKAEAEGILIETTNSTTEAIVCICMCCSCCCGPLAMLKSGIATNEAEGIHFASNYYIEKDESKCSDCGVCVERCPIGSMKMTDDGKCVYDKSICVGCGICVSTCPENALILKRKPEDKTNPVDSKDIYEMHERQQKEYREKLARKR